MKEETKFFSALKESPYIFPVFTKEGAKGAEPIQSVEGHNFWGVESLSDLCSYLEEKRVKSIALYCIPKNRDENGAEAYLEDGFVAKTITSLREYAPGLSIISDLCVCQFTASTHCMLMDGDGFSTTRTIENISRQALLHAKCGVDAVMPSGMTTGAVGAIKSALLREGFKALPIVPQAAKFNSKLYAPFRHAAHAVVEIDKSAYQLAPDAFDEAKLKLREAVSEGASGVIVKPALDHLDLIRWASDELSVPVIAFSTSGEYQQLLKESSDAISDYHKKILSCGAKGIVSYFG